LSGEQNWDVADALDRADSLAESTILNLEERIAYLERARDNVAAQRDETQAKSKRARESAGRRIEGLMRVIDELCEHIELSVVNAKAEPSIVKRAHETVREILK